MFLTDISYLVDSLLIFFFAFLIDLAFGELPAKIHPTVWMGKVIAYLKPKIRSESSRVEMINGVLLCLSVIMLFAIPAYFIVLGVQQFFGWIPYIVVSSVMLKLTFSLKGMRRYTMPIGEAVKNGDYDKARRLLPYVVRRDPSKLNESQIISAAVESISEGTTDGVTSPFVYFVLFGVPGAVAFRVINTLDSMVGYKDKEHINIGWFSASMDTIANYVPARLTAVLIVLAALLLNENWRKSWKILQRDKKNTASPNAGWTISAMAGALNVQLEKPGFYRLGDGQGPKPAHIVKALRIMVLTTVLFSVLVVFPLFIVKLLIIKFVLW